MINDIQIEKDLFDYLGKNIHDGSKIDVLTLLFREGIFDSMGFILLIEFLENKYNIKVTDIDLVEQNFESISAIKSFLKMKLATVAA